MTSKIGLPLAAIAILAIVVWMPQRPEGQPQIGQPAAAADGWTAAAPTPIARSETAAASLGGKIYVAGGLEAFSITARFSQYDPATDRWRSLAPLPRALHHVGLAAAGGRIYATGGYASMTFTADQRAAWGYDPTTDAWTPIADMPGPRAAHAMAAIDGRIYVVGGIGPAAQLLWVYDIALGAWDVFRPPLPTPREHLTAVALDGKLYVIGGRGHGAGNRAILEIYDPARNSWRRGSDMAMARGGFTAAAVGPFIHVTGGEDFAPAATFGDHEIYDPARDSWRIATPMPTPRHGLASAAIGAHWYVIGGATEAAERTRLTLSDLVEVYTEP